MTARNPSDALVVVNPITVQSIAADATFLSAAVDIRGFRYALIMLTTGTNGGTTAGSLTMTDCATSGGTYLAITDDGVNLGVSAQNAIIPIATDHDDTHSWAQIDLDQCANYMKFSLLQGSTAAGIHSVTVVLTGAEDTARHIDPVYAAKALAFDIKHRLKSESY